MVEAVALKLPVDPERLRHIALAVLASLTLNVLLVSWMTRAVNDHPAHLSPEASPITIDIVEEVSPSPSIDEMPDQPPQPVLKVQPETPPLEEAPLTPAPPETRREDTSSGAVASPLEAPPSPAAAPTPDATDQPPRNGEPEVPPQWRVSREGATLEELGAFPLYPAPQSGTGSQGSASRLRSVLNEAACADLQLSVRYGRNCPPVGAFLRYGGGPDTQLVSEEQTKRLQLSFPRSFLDESKPVMDSDGVMPKPAGENFDYHKQGASSGMVGTLPDANPHPYTQ